jgi:hypothetical protein
MNIFYPSTGTVPVQYQAVTYRIVFIHFFECISIFLVDSDALGVSNRWEVKCVQYLVMGLTRNDARAQTYVSNRIVSLSIPAQQSISWNCEMHNNLQNWR